MQSQATSHDHTPAPLPPQRRLHPLIGAAAVAVVIASLTAVAAVTGVLPLSKASPDSQPQASMQADPQGPLPVTTAPPPGSTTRPPVYDDGQPRSAQQDNRSSQAAPRSAPARQATQREREATSSQRAETERQPAAKGSPHAGRVVSVTPVQTQKPNTSGLGALGGAVVGGLLGNQVGKGNGRIVGTVVGAVGGGVAGNQIEKAVSKDTHYEVRVRMDDGSHRSFTYEQDPAVQVGERVHMENGALVRG